MYRALTEQRAGRPAEPLLGPFTAVLHLTSYFYNWPVRIWPICRPEGAVGKYSPRCRGQWPYNIPWPLCSLWWGENWPHGAPGTDPPKIGVLECATEVGLAHDPRRGN
jgi:hypothetical protein